MLNITGIACALLGQVRWVGLCLSVGEKKDSFNLEFFFAGVVHYGLPVSKWDLNKGVALVALLFYC